MKTTYSEYKLSEIPTFDKVPNHWNKSRLKYIGFMYGGLTGKSGDDFRRDDDDHRNRPFIPFTNICNNTYISNTDLKQVSIEDGENQNRVEKNDLFFLMSSETTDDIGKTSVLREDLGEVYLNSFCKGYRLTDKGTNPYFLNYLLSGNSYRQVMSIEGNGFTRINLRQDRVNDFLIYLPPLPEQEQIVKYLDEKTGEIDNLISITENKIELLKENRTSTINRVITKGLDPNVELKDSGIEWIGDIPEHWEVTRFKYVSEIVTGNTPSKTDGQKYYTEEDESGFLWVKPTNLLGYFYVNKSDEKLTELGKKQTRVIPKDSIMICCIGNTIGKYGMSGEELSTNQQINSVIPNEKTTPWYCLFYIDVFTKDLLNRSNFVTLPILTKSDLENVEFILPPLSEQEEIVKHLYQRTQEIDTLISIEQQRIETLKEYRQSLISEVITGKVRVCEEVKL